MSDGTMRSKDRGVTTDQFTTKLTWRGTEDDCIALLSHLKALRDSKTPLELTEFLEPLFGDYVDHSQPITAYVEKQTVPKMVDNGKSLRFDLTLRAQQPTVTTGDSTLPSLTCAHFNTKGGYIPKTLLAMSYNQTITMTDRELDEPTFTGEYDLTPEETAQLWRFWATTRGNAFTVSDLGTKYPFGDQHVAPYTCYIINIESDSTLTNMRRVKLTLKLAV